MADNHDKLSVEHVEIVTRFLQKYISAAPEEAKVTLQRIYEDELTPRSYFVNDWDVNDIELIRKAGLGPLEVDVFAPFLRVKYFNLYLLHGVLTLNNRHLPSKHLYFFMIGELASKTLEWVETRHDVCKRINRE